jgi:hypothetical protein
MHVLLLVQWGNLLQSKGEGREREAMESLESRPWESLMLLLVCPSPCVYPLTFLHTYLAGGVCMCGCASLHQLAQQLYSSAVVVWLYR